MANLKTELASLRLLFEPWRAAPSGAVVWEPLTSDPNASFKRDLIAKAVTIISTGDSVIAGLPCTWDLPSFPEYEEIPEVLAADPEQRNFHGLVVACLRVAECIRQTSGSPETSK
jgi:hypothetical protein